MRLEIKHDMKQLERDLGRIGQGVVQKAAPSAINRTTKTVASTATKEISAITGLKQKDVRADIKQKLASRSDITAYVDARTGRAVTLRRFITPARRRVEAGKPQFFRKKVGRKGNRRFKHKGIEAKAWNTKKVYHGSFLAKGRGGNVVPFVREGGQRDKLKALRGPSVRREFIRKPMRVKLTAKANERFKIEMDRSVNNVLRRFRR